MSKSPLKKKTRKKKRTYYRQRRDKPDPLTIVSFFFLRSHVKIIDVGIVLLSFLSNRGAKNLVQFNLEKKGGGNPLVLRRFIRSCAYVYVPLTSSLFLSLTSCVFAPSEQRCQCTSSGCTTCAARRRRYERSDRKEDCVKVVNVGPIVRTNRNRQPDPCTVATGCTGARVGSSSVPHCSPATPSMRSRSKYPGNVSSIARYLFSISLLILRGIYFHSGNS